MIQSVGWGKDEAARWSETEAVVAESAAHCPVASSNTH